MSIYSGGAEFYRNNQLIGWEDAACVHDKEAKQCLPNDAGQSVEVNRSTADLGAIAFTATIQWEKPFSLGAALATVLGISCAPNKTMTPRDDATMHPRVDPDSGMIVGDGGVVTIGGDCLIDDLGARVQEGEYAITVGPFYFSFSGADDQEVSFVVESLPGLLHEEFGEKDRDGDGIADPGFEGMLDITEVSSDATPSPFNLGYNPTGDASQAADYWIKYPTPYFSLPVYVGSGIFTDMRFENGPAKEVELSTPEQIASIPISKEICDEAAESEDASAVPVQDLCDARIGAACSESCDAATFKPTRVVVPGEFHDNEGNVEYSFTLNVDASNLIAGNIYDYRLRIRPDIRNPQEGTPKSRRSLPSMFIKWKGIEKPVETLELKLGVVKEKDPIDSSKYRLRVVSLNLIDNEQ